MVVSSLFVTSRRHSQFLSYDGCVPRPVRREGESICDSRRGRIAPRSRVGHRGFHACLPGRRVDGHGPGLAERSGRYQPAHGGSRGGGHNQRALPTDGRASGGRPRGCDGDVPPPTLRDTPGQSGAADLAAGDSRPRPGEPGYGAPGNPRLLCELRPRQPARHNLKRIENDLSV